MAYSSIVTHHKSAIKFDCVAMCCNREGLKKYKYVESIDNSRNV
jgi:hypothetical protein